MNPLQIAILELGKEEIPRGSNWGDGSVFINSIGIKFPKSPGIYKIKNLTNDKVYIGSSWNLDKRIKNHIWQIEKREHRNIHLLNAVREVGWENFFFIILETCDKENIIEREQFWIDHYKSHDRQYGYNKQPYAYSNKSNSLSDETKKKISEYQKGKPKTAEQNLKNSLAHMGERNPNFGKPISENLRKAIIESNKRRASKNGI